MKVTADTNVLVRALTADHAEQSKAAQLALSKAEVVALTMPTLCELDWVLRSYKIRPSDISGTIRKLLNAANVVVNQQAAEAGLTQLDAGGDFADGVIAYEGEWLGGDTFISFDRAAIKLMEARGQSTRLLS